MNSSQKIIKNLAIALGIFLTIFIISMIIGGIYLITSVFSIKSDNSIDKEINTFYIFPIVIIYLYKEKSIYK